MVELPSFSSFEWDFLFIDTPKGEDLILGFDFLNHFNPSIDWRQGLITFNSDPSKSFSNDLSSAKSCAALVGDSRTPSFPSSIHITALIPIHHYYPLEMRSSKRFKMFQKIILYLPFISSLGIWTFLPGGVVKAEKLPPHRVFDHHIKLEGSLPPVGVIYPLSNQESDILRAYISENLEKGFIQSSSSSAGGPVLFVKKKDGGLRLCVDYQKLIAVTRKNKYPVTPINHLLNVFNCSSISSKIDLHGAYSLLRIKEGDEYLTAFRTKYGTCLAEFCSEFNFSITYHPCGLATIPDTLSHWGDVYLEKGEDFISKNPIKFQQLIKQDEVQPSTYFAVKVEYFSNFIDSIEKALWHNSQYRSIVKELGKVKSVQDYSFDSSSQLLLFTDQVVVPNDPTIQLSILQKRHDSPLARHPGQEKTLKLVKRDPHWSGMTQFIKDYVSSCQQCSRNKIIHHKKFGLLKPLPLQNGPWICLSMDFVTQLPLSNSFESILVIVDWFSKMAVFLPTMSSITSLDLAHLFLKNIFSKHGLPSRIISDRGSLFVSSFWTNLFQKLKI
ncbi:hypothetical protein O181_013952 [Austropuccinia psidii MF-1]|uniref:Integrase catalytic domain-containing protein n=1 Tax=Austropuccinia psidii MF-1 TaxID=1389203 RepID=A0A9Q3GPE7_9BASI|nr:hypothetical protein [Austropuccinia psidii MF-1]